MTPSGSRFARDRSRRSSVSRTTRPASTGPSVTRAPTPRSSLTRFRSRQTTNRVPGLPSICNRLRESRQVVPCLSCPRRLGPVGAMRVVGVDRTFGERLRERRGGQSRRRSWARRAAGLILLPRAAGGRKCDRHVSESATSRGSRRARGRDTSPQLRSLMRWSGACQARRVVTTPRRHASVDTACPGTRVSLAEVAGSRGSELE